MIEMYQEAKETRETKPKANAKAKPTGPDRPNRDRDSKRSDLVDRPSRTVMQHRMRTQVKEELKDPNFEYRTITDDGSGSRIEEVLEDGYEIVRMGSKSGQFEADASGNTGSQLGTIVERPVGQGQRGVLVRKSKDLYDAAQQKKEQVRVEHLRGVFAHTGIPAENVFTPEGFRGQG